MNKIYLDNSAITCPSKKAVSSMLPFFTDHWGVPSAPHLMGQSLLPAMKQAYQHLFELLGAADESTLVFTSSGQEAVNHLFFSLFHDITSSTGKNHFIVSCNDEAAAQLSVRRLEEMGGAATRLPVNAWGRVSYEALADHLTPRTVLLSLSWGCGLTGALQPIEELVGLCKERGVLLHLEASHVLGKIFFDLESLGVDFITFSGELFHAPLGTGGLWMKEGVSLSPFIVGGMEQGGNRAGPFNAGAFQALGTAAQEAIESRDHICLEVARLRGRLEERIVQEVDGAVIFFSELERLPHVTAIGFPGIANEALLYLLNRKGVYASIGGGSLQQIGLLLAAAGVEESLAHSAVSFSLSRETTEDEVDQAADVVISSVKQLRKLAEKV